MRRLSLLLAILFLGAGGTAAANKKPIVAVFDVGCKGTDDLSASYLDGLADYLAARLAESGRFQVVPRSALKEKLLGSKKKSYKQCYDQSCQIELGRELAAEQNLAGQVVKLGSRCTVNLSLFDLKKAASVAAATAECDCGEDAVLGGVKEALDKLLGGSPSSRDLKPLPEELGNGGLPIKLDHQAFDALIKAHRDDFIGCVRPRKRFLKRGGAKRNVTVEITVGSDGKVMMMKVKPKALARRGPARCLQRVLRSLRFPKAQQASAHKHVFRVN